MLITRSLLLWLFVAGAAELPTSERSPAIPAERELAFALEVLLGVADPSDSSLVARWKEKPDIHLIGASAEDAEFVQTVIKDLNGILDPAGFSIRMRNGPASSAKIIMAFAPKDIFYSIAKTERFRNVDESRGNFHLWWNEKREISRAIILIDTEMQESARRHFIREELAQALGVNADSGLYPESIFYSGSHSERNAVEYHALDRQLILFLYKYLEPGDGYPEVRGKFLKYWDTLE